MSYIPLIEAQARPHTIGYSMRAKQFGNGADILADCRAVRARLRPETAPPVVRLRLAAPPVPAPVPVAVETDWAGPTLPRTRDYLFVTRETIPRGFGAGWNVIAAETIIAEVAVKYAVSVKEMKGPWRRRIVAAARFEAYYRMSMELAYSLSMIGNAMGGKEHTGVLHGIRVHRQRREVAGL